MRIIFFPKLVINEESRPHSLKNCSLVIDAQNFFYEKYDKSKLPFVLGSEANEHAKYLRSILNMFKNANVTCYFVFKGGDTDMDKKIQKAKKLDFNFESNYEHVSPVFMKEVCKQVLEETGVKYATCIMESKKDCVALARKLQCSVLSNDIEFCFKDVPYVPYTSIDDVQPNANVIKCKQFKLTDFLTKYSINKEKVAIFVALSDVNIFPQNHFNRLFQSWNVLHKNLYVQIKKLLTWLSRNSAEHIKTSVAKFLNRDDNNKFLDTVDNVLTSIRQNDTGVRVVTNYLLQAPLEVPNCDLQWFETGIATQKIAIHYINLVKHKCIQGSWAIENKEGTESLMLSMDIILYAYNLLTNFRQTQITLYRNNEEFIKLDTKCKIPKPTSYKICNESVFENGWENIRQLELFQPFLVQNDINLNIIEMFPEDARILFIALVYFARKKEAENIDVRKEIYCFVISYVMLNIVFEERVPQKLMKLKMSGINENDCKEATLATARYFKTNKVEEMEIFNGDVLKTLVELQYCLVHMNYLNSLCGSPYKTTMYHRTFNGTFVYKLLLDMDDSKFIRSLFKTAPSVLNFIEKLIGTYKKLFQTTI